MGLRTASVRHPHVEVMAPALTETTKIQFSLPSKQHLENATPVDIYTSKCLDQQTYFKINESQEFSSFSEVNNESICNKLKNNSFKQLIVQRGINYNLISNIMSSSPSPSCDQENKMGLQKTILNFSNMNKQKLKNMERLFSNIESVQETELSCTGDLGARVDDIISAFKSIEGDKLSTEGTELGNNEIFSMGGADLANNLSPFEKDLLENVDVMNIEMEDQHDDTANIQKESQAKDLLKEIEKRHVKIERKLDFLRRRAHKLQSRLLGQHVSHEISGVYENVYRLLKKPKDICHLNSSRIIPYESVKEKVKPFSPSCAKNLIRKLEMTSLLQANSFSHQKCGSKYFGSGSVELPLFRNVSSGIINLIPWAIEEKGELCKMSSQLKTQLCLSQKEVDSEVTESSSGGESCDEMQSYNNPHQQYLSV